LEQKMSDQGNNPPFIIRYRSVPSDF
jgi:hypothetical protein